VAEAGLAGGFRFPDLHHIGKVLAASSGATRELLHRMGRGSMRAALIYQPDTSKRGRQVAAAIDAWIGRGNKPLAMTTGLRSPARALRGTVTH
jgi:hypothetical protein